MKLNGLRVAFVAGALAFATTSMSASARQPSMFLQCDGKPAHMGDGERAARILAITAVVGLLIPGPEQPNSTERLSGSAGMAACSAALASEHDPIRRIELTLARAIHGIEANDSVAALADSQEALSISQAYVNDRYFSRSLGLSVLEVRSAALLSAGKYDDAEEIAYKMADAAPWDVVNQLNAWPLAGLTDDHNQQFETFLARLSKLWENSLKSYASRLEWNGKFREASEVYAGIMDIAHHAGEVDPAKDPRGFWKARQAVALMLAGDRAKSDTLAAEARAINDGLADHHAMNASETISLTDELLEFHRVLSLLADGKTEEARAALKARSRWHAPSTASLSLTVDRLRQGVPATELVGPLARSGAQIRQSILDDDQGTERDPTKLAKRLFAHMRPLMTSGEFGGSKALWNSGKSRYLVAKKGALANVPFEVINTFDVYGIPSSYAVLLHAAVLAQSRGKEGFIILGGRKQTDTIAVQFGNSGDAGTPPVALIKAADVIRDLQTDFPPPAS